MGFADFYFQRFKTYNTNIPDEPVSKNLNLTVVIPSYREYKLFETLKCLSENQVNSPVEIIVLFNTKISEDDQIVEMHRLQAQKLKQFNTDRIKFIPVIEENIPVKIAGAGLARKLGMDLALRRYNQINNPDGIILSLDADTLCPKTYLQTVLNEFNNRPKAPGATIAFEHPIEGDQFPQEVYDAVVLYELYMRYYIQALRYIGFPYAYHTIGSAFAVRAWAYAKQGGMGLHQAGEDFYFLHKIIPLGNFFEIKSTRVYPSPRMSNRVVFGTGPAVRRIISDKNYDYPTYPLDAFLQLKPLFENILTLYKKNLTELTLHPWLVEFMENNNFEQALEKMRANSASEATFEKRFYTWFDAFQILKFLNYLINDKKMTQVPIKEVAHKLLSLLNIQTDFNARNLLLAYRKLQN